MPLSVGGPSKDGSDGGLIVPPYKLLLGKQLWQGYTPSSYPSATHHEPTSFKVPLDCGTEGCLFDIVEDELEQHDLAKQLPAKLTELRERFAQIAATKYTTPGMTPPCQSYSDVVESNGGFWAPFNDSLPYPTQAP